MWVSWVSWWGSRCWSVPDSPDRWPSSCSANCCAGGFERRSRRSASANSQDPQIQSSNPPILKSPIRKAYTFHSPMTKRSVLHAFAVLALLFTSGGTFPSAQTCNTPMDNALNLLRAGQYDQVEPVLRDDKDPRAVALRARAHIARGRYQEAEKLLVPAVAAAPGSDAALELGLLQQYL